MEDPDLIQVEQGSGSGFLYPDLIGESAVGYLIVNAGSRGGFE